MHCAEHWMRRFVRGKDRIAASSLVADDDPPGAIPTSDSPLLATANPTWPRGSSSGRKSWIPPTPYSTVSKSSEAPPQTDEMYFRRGWGSRIIREMAPVDSGELQAVLANDLGRRSGSRSRRIGVVPEPK